MKEQVTILTAADEEVQLPLYGSEEAAGADVRARLSEPYTLEAGAIAVMATGLYFEIPEGYEIQVRPRSGLAAKHGVTVLNAPGTIDSDYRGELKVILINHGKEAFVIEPGMRIAQLVAASVVRADFSLKEALAASSRGSGGLGSTGFQ